MSDDAQRRPEIPDVPEAEVAKKSRWSVQLVWLIPLLAALIGGWLAVKAILDQGPTITIVFKSAEGLEAGKTKLKYKDVEIGVITAVSLSKDLKEVVATAELVKEAKPYLVEDTRFWVVRARIVGGTVSGIGTLLSGSYIGIDVGKSSVRKEAFRALENPPVVEAGTAGREFMLRSQDLGSLDIGSPIFFRRIQVGQVASYELDKDGSGVTMRIFVNEPYDQYVTENTRFWNASGVDVKVDSSGIKVDTQSVVSILLGGVAFETPLNLNDIPRAAEKTVFRLFSDRGSAMRNPERDVLRFSMIFDDSVRGLSEGAVVELRGIPIGEVVSVGVELDSESHRVVTPVQVNLYPDRLRQRAVPGKPQPPKLEGEKRKRLIDGLIERGMRAQLRTGNLLSGQLYIALDFFPDAAKARIDWSAVPNPQMPTIPGSLEELQASLKIIANKFKNFPMEKIGADLRQTLQSANSLIKRMDTDLTPEAVRALTEAQKALGAAQGMMSDQAPIQHDTREAMRELARTAKAFRVLADYLERHPEALIRGKQEDEQ